MGYYISYIYYSFSKQTWWLILIALIFVLRKTIFNVAREAGDYGATIDSSTSLAIVGIVLTIFVAIKKFSDIKYISRNTQGLLLYYVFAWLSFLWAGNFTSISFKALETICNIYLLSLIILSIKEERFVAFFIIFFSTACVCLDLTRYYMIDGFRWYHTNAYTIPAFIGLLMSVGCIKLNLYTWKELLPFVLINAYAWISGTSTASYISAIIGFIFLFSSTYNGIHLGRTLLVCVTVYIIWVLFEDSIYSFVIAGHSKITMETGTGRSLLWEAAFKSWREAPWFGKGFIVGETGLGGYRQISAHNSFVSVLVNTGIIGSVIFSFFIFRWIWITYKNSITNVYASITLPVVIAICINLNACPVLASHWSYVTDSVLAVIAASLFIFNENEDCDVIHEEDEASLE